MAKVVRRYVVSKLDALPHVSVLVLVVDVRLKEDENKRYILNDKLL